jgi:hypothetical protein
MSGAIQAIVGVVEIAAGVLLIETPLGAPLILAGSANLLGYAVSLLNNPHRQTLVPIGASYAGTLEPRRIIYGTLKVAGMYTAPPLTSGPCHDFADYIALATGDEVLQPLSGPVAGLDGAGG